MSEPTIRKELLAEGWVDVWFRQLNWLIEQNALVVKLDMTTTYERNLYPLGYSEILPDGTFMLTLRREEAGGDG